MIDVVRDHSELLLSWMTCDSLNQVMNVKALRAFHRRIRNARDVEINVLVVHRKVELIRIITIFEMTVFLHFVQSFLSIGLPRSVGISDGFFSLSIGLPRSIRCSSPFEIQTFETQAPATRCSRRRVKVATNTAWISSRPA